MFTAADADVIKTYVRLGLGVGIVADIAHDPQTDGDLVTVDASHLFSPSVTPSLFGAVPLRGYMYRFVNLFAPHLSRELIGKFLRSQGRAEAEKIFESVDVPLLEFRPPIDITLIDLDDYRIVIHVSQIQPVLEI